MNTYYYLVLLKKYSEVVGTVTTTDDGTGQTWTQPCKLLLSPTPEIITGYVLAEDDEKAHDNAQDSLLSRYPLSSGYREHELVKVKQVEEQEEQEWDAIVSQPRVRQAIRRLAQKARRQDEAGETEEGGFAPEEEQL